MNKSPSSIASLVPSTSEIKLLDTLDKYIFEEESGESWYNKRCPETSHILLPFPCEKCNTVFSVEIWCSKPYCPVCGKLNSIPHKRRLARMMPKAMQLGVLDENRAIGAYVFTVPDVLRFNFKVHWNYYKAYRKFIRRTLRNIHGKDVLAVEFIHFSGDAKVKEESEAVHNFNPHFHIIVGDGKGYSKEDFEEFACEMRNRIRKYFCNSPYFRSKIKDIDNVIKEVNFHYQYIKDVKRKLHHLRYCSRATLPYYDEDLERVRKNKPTYLYMGKFNKDVDMTDVITRFVELNPDNELELDNIIPETIFNKKECISCGGNLLPCKGVMSLKSIYSKYKQYARGLPIGKSLWISETVPIYEEYILEKIKGVEND